MRSGPPITIPCRWAAFSAEGDLFWAFDDFGKTLSLYDVETRRQIFGPVQFPELPEFRWAWALDGCIYALVEKRIYSQVEGVPPQVQFLHRKIPFKLKGATPFMCDLAEAISSRKVTNAGSIELVPVSKDTFRSLARQVAAEKGDDPFLQWAKWLLLERDSELGTTAAGSSNIPP